MFKPALFLLFIATYLFSCKSHTKVVKITDDSKPTPVEVNYSDKTGADKFVVLQNRVFVKNTVTISGVGEAFLFANQNVFEKVFGYAEVNSQPASPIDYSKNRVLAIVGQPTEYPTTFNVKSTYSSPEGYVVRIQENQDPNKASYTMMPHLLLEIPNSYSGVKFIVYIDQKLIEVKNLK